MKKRVTITMSPELIQELRTIQATSMLEDPKSFSQVISMLLMESLLQRKADVPLEKIPGIYSY